MSILWLADFVLTVNMVLFFIFISMGDIKNALFSIVCILLMAPTYALYSKED
jgi:hypothetical protein